MSLVVSLTMCLVRHAVLDGLTWGGTSGLRPMSSCNEAPPQLSKAL